MPWHPEGPWEGHVPYRWNPIPPDEHDLSPEARRVIAIATQIRRIQARGEQVKSEKLIQEWLAAARDAAYVDRARKTDYTHEAGILNDCIRLAKVANGATMLAQAALAREHPVTARRDRRDAKPSARRYRGPRRPDRQRPKEVPTDG